jgi:hypothetical protein
MRVGGPRLRHVWDGVAEIEGAAGNGVAIETAE